MEKKVYYGLDLLKFIMALMVVMIHVKPNVHSEILTAIFNPLMGVAVPIFFVISSMLIFSRVQKGGSLGKWCKRLSILYLVWLLIDSWFIVFRKGYFKLGLVDGTIDFVKDLFLGSTYPGSWFLSALLMSVIVVFFLSKILHPYVVMFITLLVAMYVRNISLLPDDWLGPYDWYASHVREEVNLSFPSQMVWISFGQIIASNLSLIEKHRKVFFPLCIIISVVCYALAIWCKNPFSIYFFVIAVFIVFFLLKLPNHPVYKRMREISILMFLFHFSIAGKMDIFCSFVGDSLLTNYVYYFLVLGISIVFAESILRLEKIKVLGFLKYTH